MLTAMKRTLAVLVNTLLYNLTLAYVLVDEHKGVSFFEGFDFFTDQDPTHGFVRYVDSSEALEEQMIRWDAGNHSDPTVYIGLGHQDLENSHLRSIRITSRDTYKHGLLVADIASIPSQCGLWPALWLVGPNWPQNGEIDLLEQTNGASQNSMTLHTSSKCSITNSSEEFAGTLITSDCDFNSTAQPNNAGCSIVSPINESFTINGTDSSYATAGQTFNLQGGGVYAMQWSSTGVVVWFFPRGHVPLDITTGTPDPDKWSSRPQARFIGTGCNFDTHLQDMKLVINTDVCGDWAGSTWVADGCAASTGVATCDEYVSDNPGAFLHTYWQIKSIKMYEYLNNTIRRKNTR